MKCEECSGRGHFLFPYSTPQCDLCNGTGKIPEPQPPSGHALRYVAPRLWAGKEELPEPQPPSEKPYRWPDFVHWYQSKGGNGQTLWLPSKDFASLWAEIQGSFWTDPVPRLRTNPMRIEWQGASVYSTGFDPTFTGGSLP